MRAWRTGAVASLAVLATICEWQGHKAIAQQEARPPVSILFAPEHPCTETIVAEIQASSRMVHVQAYRLTSKPIIEALVQARRRGLPVTVLLDKEAVPDGGQRTDTTPVESLLREGVDVFMDDKHRSAHNKVIILDAQTVITGSFNFTKAAEDNAENVLIFRGLEEISRLYAENFNHHMEHSVELVLTAPANQPPPAARKNRFGWSPTFQQSVDRDRAMRAYRAGVYADEAARRSAEGGKGGERRKAEK